MHGLQHKRMKVDPPNTEKVNSLDKNFGRRTFNYTGRWLSARMKQDITLSQKKNLFKSSESNHLIDLIPDNCNNILLRDSAQTLNFRQAE